MLRLSSETKDGEIFTVFLSKEDLIDYVRQARQDIDEQTAREEERERGRSAVQRAFLTTIKVLHGGGRQLKSGERPYIGTPKPIPRGKRGPPKKPIVDDSGVTRPKTQFDVWLESLAEGHRRLAKLPLISRRGAEARRRKAAARRRAKRAREARDPIRRAVFEFVRAHEKCLRESLDPVGIIRERLAGRGLDAPAALIKKYLAEARKTKGRKNPPR